MPWLTRTTFFLGLVLPEGVRVHVHHHFHGLAGGYVGLAAAALTSWAGVPGPGEAALATAGVVAAHGKLDIVEVVLVAWLGAMVGGVGGWLVGRIGGKALVTTPGPLRRGRRRTLARGERFYERYGFAAVFFTPSWMAGIAEMGSGRFLAANALAALAWSLTIGLGSYFAGPPILEVVSDVGLAGVLVLVGAAAVGAAVEARRRRRR